MKTKKGQLALNIFMAFLIILIYVYGISGILSNNIRDQIITNANTTALTQQVIVFAIPFFLVTIIASYWWFIKGENYKQ